MLFCGAPYTLPYNGVSARLYLCCACMCVCVVGTQIHWQFVEVRALIIDVLARSNVYGTLKFHEGTIFVPYVKCITFTLRMRPFACVSYVREHLNGPVLSFPTNTRLSNGCVQWPTNTLNESDECYSIDQLRNRIRQLFTYTQRASQWTWWQKLSWIFSAVFFSVNLNNFAGLFFCRNFENLHE